MLVYRVEYRVSGHGRSCPGSHAVGARHAFRQRPDGARGRAGYATRLTATANALTAHRHHEVFHSNQDKRTGTRPWNPARAEGELA